MNLHPKIKDTFSKQATFKRMTTIDLRTIPASIPSLCIPRVFTNIGEKRIRNIFDELNMGEIDRVDIVSKTTEKGEKFNRVFVHFKRWSTDGNAEVARQRLLNGQDIKIIYDDPWFWKISAYRPPVTSQSHHSNRRPQQKAPRLELDDTERRNRSPPRRVREDRERRNRSPPRPVKSHYERPRTPDGPPPREEYDEDERVIDPEELARDEAILKKHAEVAAQLSIPSEPAVNKSSAALKKLLKKPLTIETDIAVPCVSHLEVPCGCDKCMDGEEE